MTALSHPIAPDLADTPHPLDLYAGAPTTGHAPGVAALAMAYAHFRSHYQPTDPEHRLILDGAARAFAALQERPWTVLTDGALEITGSTGDLTYLVRDDCRQKDLTQLNKATGRLEPALCPSFRFAQRRHGGACYHVIAREILRLAQVIEIGGPPSSVPLVAIEAAPYLPFVTLSGRLLGLALGIARLPEQLVTLRIEGLSLIVTAGDPPLHCVRLTCSEGQGQIAAQLSAESFSTLWLPFRPVATHLAQVMLCIDPADGLVLLSGDQFSAEAVGVLR